MFPPLENLKFWAGAGVVALVLSSSHLLDGLSYRDHDEQVIAALMDGCAAGVPSCIAVVKALADKHGYHTAEIDE